MSDTTSPHPSPEALKALTQKLRDTQARRKEIKQDLKVWINAFEKENGKKPGKEGKLV